MITITGIGQFDESNPVWEQSEEVKNFLLPIIDRFNSMNCIEFDEFDRPLKWIFEGNGIRLTYTRVYQEESYQRMVKDHQYVVTSIL